MEEEQTTTTTIGGKDERRERLSKGHRKYGKGLFGECSTVL